MMDPKELEVAKIIAKVFKEWGIHEGRNGGGDFYKWLAEEIAQEEKGKRWRPELTEIYYFIDTAGIVVNRFYANSLGEPCVDAGNCYKTYAEAQKHTPAVLAAYIADVE